eukprot:RCo018544
MSYPGPRSQAQQAQPPPQPSAQQRAAAMAAKEAGNSAFQRGDALQAIQHYSEALQLCPGEATLWSNRSAAYRKAQQFHRSVEDAQRCIALSPDWPKGHFRLGEAYMDLGLLAKAVDAFSKARDLDPNDEGIRSALGRADSALRKRVTEEERVTVASHYSLGSSPGETSPDSTGTRSRGCPGSSSSSSAGSSSRHAEIMARCVGASPGILTMEDYRRFREAGGARLAEDPSAPAFISTKLPEMPPEQRRSEFFNSLGIREPAVALDPPQVGLGDSFGGGATRLGSSRGGSQKTDLQKARAELLASLQTQSAGSSKDWDKIIGLHRSTASASGGDSFGESRRDDPMGRPGGDRGSPSQIGRASCRKECRSRWS